MTNNQPGRVIYYDPRISKDLCLVAAAPEMLEALELLVDNEPLTALPFQQRWAILAKADAAIRKAKGEL